MADLEFPVRQAGKRRVLNAALLGGASLLALMLGKEPVDARSLNTLGSIAPTASAQQAAIAAAQQAAGAAAQAQASMSRAAAALATMRKLQSDAAAAAKAVSSSVPNGLTPGGLMPAGGTASDPFAGVKADPSKLVGVDTVSETSNPAGVAVDIHQTQQKAILYWDTFNVGAKTTVNFQQQNSDWIALNRVLDPTASPTRILGQVNALGAVYIINPNGIIFGAGSQINVHTLIASSLDIGKLGDPLTARDDFFLKTGVANLNSFSFYDPATTGSATSTAVAGNVTVERGASINATIATDNGEQGSAGAIYLFGANVSNSGAISAPTGEVAMVAARTIDLIAHGFSALPAAVVGTDDKGNALRMRGTEFSISQFASAYDTAPIDTGSGSINPHFGYPTQNKYLPGTGAVSHDGLIEASRGIVIMNGDTVSIDNPGGDSLRDAAGNLVQGVISVDTSIDRNSMVLLRAATRVSMNGVITSLPFDDGTEPLPSGSNAGSTVQSFTPAYIEMSAQSTVTVGSSGLVSAPSAQVVLRAIDLSPSTDSALAAIYLSSGADGSTLNYNNHLFNQSGINKGEVDSNTSQSPQTVLLAPGATVDVSGLRNVELPAGYNFISFKPLAEFADMPLQRSGPLYGETLWIDIRASGTRSDGTSWVGTPLADASGYVNKVGRSIYQLMTVGGSVSMSTDLTAANGGGKVQTAGSVINVAGGSVNFQPGMVSTTRLLGIDGRIYSMANADPNMTYVGIAGQFTVNHARWNVKETWSTGTQTYSPGYSEGQAAGGVSITTVTPSLNGTIYFGSVAGERQLNSGKLPSQGTLALTTPSNVQIGPAPSADYTTQSAVTTVLSADTLSGYGLSALSVTANDFMVSGGSTLSLAAGGSLSVTAGGGIDIAGTVSAAGGSIDLVADRLTISDKFVGLFKAPKDQSGTVIAANVYVEGTLDVSGRFVNDTGRAGADISGPGYINGGSISITTNKSSLDGLNGAISDKTGSILLAKGSVLDVSSGGYISPLGKPKTVSAGVMAGKAGAISLSLYQGTPWKDAVNQAPGINRPNSGAAAVLQLDGSLRGYGFESNGSLKLAGADTIRIGGSLQAGETSSIVIGGQRSVLPVALLTDGGFGAYTIESVPDGWSAGNTTAANVIVSAGANLTLQQQNLSSTADYGSTATGTRLGQPASPTLALLPDDQRKPANLTLNAEKIVLDTGSAIVTDPKASITFGAVNPDLTLKASNPTRTVAAQSVELRGRIIDHGGSVFINSLATHLGAQGLVDLSGTFIANSRFGIPGGAISGGSYLAGGSFTLEAGNLVPITTFVDTSTSNSNNNKFYYTYSSGAGYAVADAGATVDVSGASGPLQVAGARGATSSVWSWSDAGTVSADVQGFAWGGSFVATGGRYVGADGQMHADPRANNGTFIVGGSGISLRQDASDVNAKVAAFDSKQGGPNSIWLSANQLAPFDNIFLYSANANGGAARFFNELPAFNRLSGSNVQAQTNEVSGSVYNIPILSSSFSTLTVTGSLNWNVGSGLRIAAGTITSSPLAGDTTPSVTINAPYVLLTGGGGTTADGHSTFTANARTIDVEGAALSGFSQVSLISAGDIRLSTPRVSNTIDKNTGVSTFPTSFPGSLATNGDLLLQAQRIYPVSAVDFTIKTPGKVTFVAPAASDTAVPLSAGGSLTVIAKTILQAGNLFAPLGKITLGNLDSAVSAIMTQSVTLAPGSLTSVTLADTTVPYGATLDGTSWYYNASTTPTSLPSKGLTLAGANVTRSDGSTIDVRGGGDLQAAEWIQGKGGSRDTLTTTPSGQAVYALVPSQSAAVAAFDVHFTTTRSLDAGKTIISGDVDPLAGTQITIAGGNGIPAGTYTLYPAHYATLPGAMRVVVYGSNLGRGVPTGTTLPDGTVLVTGNVTQSTSPSKQSSGETLFAVQTGAVWQQYSEYAFNSANRFFRQLAVKQGLAVPRLPIDAGRLSVAAQQSILLNGIALTQPGRDADGNIGRGAELDITAPKMAVIGHAQYVNNDIPTGYVGLDIAQLNDFESIMVGGLRSDPDNNGTTLITPTATSVVVDTGGETFSAPEILLVATPVKTAQTIAQNLTISTSPSSSQVVTVTDTILASDPDSGTVTIAARSVIATTGIVHAGAGRNYSFGPTAKDVAAALGGTLDASGTVITGADLSKLNISTTNPDNNKAYSHAGTADRMLQDYAAQTGALFVATNDTSLNVTGPAATPLTIQFAPGSEKVLTGSTKTDTVNVNGSLQLSPDGGRVTIWAGANITTKALTLQGTASTSAVVINSNDLHVGQLNLAARSVALGSRTLRTDTGLALYNLQFADVGALAVKALSGTIAIYGDYNPGQSVTNLTLDAAALVRAGDARDAVISDHRTITLVNTSAISTATSSPSASNDFNLSFNAQQQIVLGGGAQSILGYGQVNLNTLGRVYVAGAGSLSLGDVSDSGTDAVKLGIATPAILVAGATGANGGAFAVTTKGSISLTNNITPHGLADRPDDSAETGGKLSLVGASISIGTTVQAQAGTISVEAKQGDVTLTERAYLAAGGYKKTLVDVDTYLSGGKVVLTSDKGNITTDQLSVIDVAQPDGGLGHGGEIDMTAVGGNASLAGFLRGSGGAGLGGSFKLDIKGPADLTALADKLKSTALDNQMHSFGGFSGTIDIHTRTGNLVLAEKHSLKAQAITLTVDDTTWVDGDVTQQFGQIYIGGLIDATGYGGSTLDGTGQAGGQVSIFAANSVTLASAGVIDASTTHADERGGDVTVGIGWGAKSKIYLQTGTRINVSGGTKGGLSGGTVTFRAPRDGNDDVRIAGLSNVRNDRGAFYELPTIDGTNITITGARSLTVDGFVAFDTNSSSHGIDGSTLGWTGGIDPAGWYSNYGNNQAATSGTWTNIAGWQISIRTSAPFDNAPTGAVRINDSTGKGSGATLTNFVMGMNSFTADNKSATIPGNSSGSFRITAPAGGRDATGTWSTSADGTVTMSFTDVGAGFVTKPTTATFTLPNGTSQTLNAATTSFFGQIKVLSDLKIVSADVSLPAGGGGYDGTSKLTATLSGSNGSAAISFSQASGVGHESNGTFVSDTPIFIPFASSGVFALDPAKQNTPGVANFIGDDQTTDRRFFASTLTQVTQGTWTYNNQSYGLKNLFTRLQPLVDQLGSDVVHVKPGVELVNSSATVNSGNITVVNNWNLAAGTAGGLKTTGGVTSFDPDQSYVKFVYRLATPWGGLEAGDLTLRAAANINVNASISDGFFQFGTVTSATATTRVIDGTPGFGGSNTGLYKVYLTNSNTSLTLPYSDAANVISPTSSDLAAADLFPHTLKVCISSDCSASNLKTVTAPASWSYALTAGADLASANPAARTTLANAQAANKGDVIVDKHSSYTQSLVSDGGASTSTIISLPTMVRTGTGNISIAAARDVILRDTDAPGVIYAAGVNTRLDGFLDPRVQSYGNFGTNFSSGTGLYGGPPDAAAFPERGGDVRIDAQQDIKGYVGSDNKVPQYYQQWLLSYTAPSASKTFGAGVFAPSGTAIPSQTAWWIQYGSFQQGILSAGGNVDVTAGRDLLDVSVSAPTTGRVSGGLSATDTPVTHLYGGGNVVVRAGRDIRGGSFYEGSGHASIVAGGSIGQNGTISRYQSSPLQLPDVPRLAVDTGQIAMVAGGSVAIAGVVNPAELHAQPDNASNPLKSGVTTIPLYMDTYGPDSKVRVVAEAGDLTISIAPTAITDTSGAQLQAAASIYPASFEALALDGSLVTTGLTTKDGTGAVKTIKDLNGAIPMPGIILSPSEHGTFELLAEHNVDLTFGYPAKTAGAQPFPRPVISAGAALIDTAYDPYQPNNDQHGASQGALLAHQDDVTAGVDTLARIYAATGNITATGSYDRRTSNDSTTSAKTYQRIEINRPTKIYAGNDIVDLNIIVQNIHSSDVSKIEAGGNITYTGYSNGGGLQVAGPGFFVVQAGGDIGPFLPLAHDNASEALIQQGIASVGNASATPVGDIYVSNSNGGGSVGIYDQSLFGPAGNPRRNTLLTDVAGTRQGADIVTLFGTKFGVDYQAVINAYVDPANTAKVDHNYLTELQAFLAKVGIATTDGQDAWRKFTNADKLPVPPVSKDLQQVFADQVFFAELKAVGIGQQSSAGQFQRGYQAINAMFPSSLGYTANALGGGNGTNQLVKTGNLNLQHGTIQTRLGGDISIFGPGGNILVGPLGLEPNARLKLSDLGILTLGGGAINTFTDESVRVNSSRVLTTQGGDVLMWSSNADLDAGRGSKTTLSAPALQVEFDQNDYQTVDLSGFVTGAGIATLQASKVAKPSNLYLVAPRGIIDFGTAGVRSSGNAVFVAPVIANASNLQVQGTTTGIPVISVPNVGALTSGSNAGAAATKPAEVSTASGNRDQASVFIVEVVGYGGGDGQGEPAANGDAKPDERTKRTVQPTDEEKKGP